MKDFRKLNVWQKAHQLVLQIYKSTKNYPKGELYGLTSQIRRSAVSIPANIAEGCGRDSDSELKRFCIISLSSASELEYHLLLSNDLGYISNAEYENLTNNLAEIKRMLGGFIQ